MTHFPREDNAIDMPTKLNINEMYTSNTFSDYTSTSREMLGKDNLPLSNMNTQVASQEELSSYTQVTTIWVLRRLIMRLITLLLTSVGTKSLVGLTMEVMKSRSNIANILL